MKLSKENINVFGVCCIEYIVNKINKLLSIVFLDLSQASEELPVRQLHSVSLLPKYLSTFNPVANLDTSATRKEYTSTTVTLATVAN
jgi:hypothetical protein